MGRAIVGVVGDACFDRDLLLRRCPLRGRDRSHEKLSIHCGARYCESGRGRLVLTSIFYSGAALFAVETAPTRSWASFVGRAIVGAVLTAIFRRALSLVLSAELCID